MKKFHLGELGITPQALKTILEAGTTPLHLLMRHQQGDWGDLTPDDVAANEWSLQNDARLLSAYNLFSGERIWVITEWDRSRTTLLLPSEY